jgi:hypothetical protein
MMTPARITAGGVLALLITSLGCSPSNPDAPCRVEGKVTYNNNPVTGGTVCFHAADGVPYNFPIFANGAYNAELKEGTYTVTVETESLNPNKKEDNRAATGARGAYGSGSGGKAGGGGYSSKYKAQQGSPMPDSGAPKAEYVKIPPKYAAASSSGLSFTAKRGKNEYPITLTD